MFCLAGLIENRRCCFIPLGGPIQRMDQSFASVGSSRYPPGEPDDNWTIDELLRWSLDKHRHIVIDKTATSIALLKEQCERECEDVLTLHTMAVEIESNRRLREKEGDAAAIVVAVNDSSSNDNKGSNVKYEENQDPQRMSLDVVTNHPVPPPPPPAAQITSTSTAVTATTTTEVEPDITVSSSSPTITVQITVGPHAPTSYTLHPKPNTPCVIGRSKGKKFSKNGISLYKDQEVSTTHGKFLVVMEDVEEEGKEEVDDDNDGAAGSSSTKPRYYYVDVGSTNGTIYNGLALVANVKLELKNGMEIKVGNSLLRMILH